MKLYEGDEVVRVSLNDEFGKGEGGPVLIIEGYAKPEREIADWNERCVFEVFAGHAPISAVAPTEEHPLGIPVSIFARRHIREVFADQVSHLRDDVKLLWLLEPSDDIDAPLVWKWTGAGGEAP